MTAARCPVKTAGVALISRQHYDALRVIFDTFNLSELSNARATMPNAAPTIAQGAITAAGQACWIDSNARCNSIATKSLS